MGEVQRFRKLKSAFGNISISQVSGYYNLIPKLTNAQIYLNTRMNGFNTSGTTPVLDLVSQKGYTTIVVPVASFGENVTIKWEPGSAVPNNYGIFARYSSTSTSYNIIKNSNIETYSGWDLSYNATTHAATIMINAIKTVSTDMLVFCWYDQFPWIYPTSLMTLDSGTIQLRNIIGNDQLTTDLQTSLSVTRSGTQEFAISDIVQGTYDNTGAIVDNPSRIRVNNFIRVFKGDKIKFYAGENVN